MRRSYGTLLRPVRCRSVRLYVGALEGCVGKTTTAVHVALGLSRSGRTLLVDAGSEQSQAYEWSSVADEWPHDHCEVISLADRVRPMMAGYEHVVFDIGPKNPWLLRQAMTLADDLVAPVAPSTGELPKRFELAAEVDATHPLRAGL